LEAERCQRQLELPRRRPGWICTVTRLSVGPVGASLLAASLITAGRSGRRPEAAGVSVRCARKWVGRYRAGDRQLFDHSSAPRRVANRTDRERVEVIVKLRRLRMTAAEIAETLAMPLSTVSGILTRIGVGRLGRLGLEPAVRYERSRPGELVSAAGRRGHAIPRRRRFGRASSHRRATARSTAQGANGAQPLTAGSGTPTIADDTQPSATNHRPPEPTCSALTLGDPDKDRVGRLGRFGLELKPEPPLPSRNAAPRRRSRRGDVLRRA
jgi:hypothetical protein